MAAGRVGTVRSRRDHAFGRAGRGASACAGQTTALHGVFFLVGKGFRRRWVATSWILTALHLGMLEDRSHLGAANTLTLARANLPVTGPALGRWLGITALTTDFVDGKLARHTGNTTPFGRYADHLQTLPSGPGSPSHRPAAAAVPSRPR